MTTPVRLVAIAALSAAAFSPLAAQAADGEITITGRLLEHACAVSVVGGNTTTLERVTQEELPAVNSVSRQEATITFSLSNCDPSKTKALASFTHNRPAGDNSGYLPQTNLNPGAARGYGFLLHDRSGRVIHAVPWGTNNWIHDGSEDNISTTTNTATLKYLVRYIRVATNVSPGIVTSTAMYTMNYL